jgi:enoyl reductase
VTKVLRFVAIATAAGSVWLGSMPSAFASVTNPGAGSFGGGSGSGSGTSASAGASGNKISSGLIVFDRSKNGSGTSVGAVTSATSWTPPACYYAPKHTPKELEAQMRQVWESSSPSPQWALKTQNYFVNGKPYKDFNKDKEGKGHWWDAYITEGREADPAAQDCNELPFWVDDGDAPPANAPQAIDPEMLAQLAYAEVRVPSTNVELAPKNTTKVNLPTWAWLDIAKFKPVSVTASVPMLGLSATTTAEPVSLKITPGTDDAVTYPASGNCEIRDGRIGEPFARGNVDKTPPCGVKYLRSSGDESYKLQATITWKISWTSTTGQGGDLPNGTFGADQDVVVQEIQAVNR